MMVRLLMSVSHHSEKLLDVCHFPPLSLWISWLFVVLVLVLKILRRISIFSSIDDMT